MYNPGYSKNDDTILNLRLIEKYPLGTLISQNEGRIETSFLPFIVEKEGDSLVLLAHLARANPHSRSLQNSEVLVNFQGPSRYISPSVYVEKMNVPTWNYACVQVHGTVELVENNEGIEAILHKSVEFFERRNGTAWNYDLPEQFRSQLVRAIVGFKIRVGRIEGKFKLSQNRSEPDYEAVSQFLQNSPKESDQEMLGWMNLVSTKK